MDESSMEPSSIFQANGDYLDSSAQFTEQESSYRLPEPRVEYPIRTHDGRIIINVRDPGIKQEKLKKYIVYTIRGSDAQGPFENRRRYSDFFKIRQILASRWPGCHIPPLPPKKFNNMDKRVIEERMKHLEFFCQRIAESPYLHYSSEYQIFLRVLRRELPQRLQEYEACSNEDILERYNANPAFKDLLKKEPNNQTITKIAEFKLTLQRVLDQFGALHEAAQRFARRRKTFYDKMGVFHKTVCVGYEKTIFGEYHNHSESGNVFIDSPEYKISGNVEKVEEAVSRESVDNITDWLEMESMDVTAFLDAFTERDRFENLKNKMQEKQQMLSSQIQKVLGGQYSLSAKLFGKSKEETVSLEKKICSITQEIETLRQIHDLITLILAEQEIDKFKTKKLEKYYQIIKMAAQNEIMNLNSVYEYWDTVSKNPNINNDEISHQ